MWKFLFYSSNIDRLFLNECLMRIALYILCCFAVSALRAIKNSLVDPVKHLENWNKGIHVNPTGLEFYALMELGMTVTCMSNSCMLMLYF